MEIRDEVVAIEVVKDKTRAVYVIGSKPEQNMFAIKVSSIVESIELVDILDGDSYTRYKIKIKFDNSDFSFYAKHDDVAVIRKSYQESLDFFAENSERTRMFEIQSRIDEEETDYNDDGNSIIPITL